MNYETVASNIRAELKTYLQTSGLKSLVLGISGGIDSALCVALAKPVCDELGIPIYGRFLKIETNKADEMERGDMVGEVFCHDYKQVELSGEYNVMRVALDACEGEIGDERADKIRLGNVKARMRMVYLYNIAQLHSGMVLSTDNFTELLLGFWTLHGDVGDYGMVQNLWKMEVYGLSTWLAENEGGVDSAEYNALMSCVHATPTDGLGITSSDVEQLGAKNYAEVDAILKAELETPGSQEHTVAKRFYATQFKRENPYNLPREVVCKDAL